MAKVKLSDGNTAAKKEKKKLNLSKKAKIIIGSCAAAVLVVVCSIFFAKDYRKIEAQNAYTITASDPATLFDAVRDEAYDAEREKETKE
ncbi:MAG: hypothetical protein IJR36_09280 [Lachnospiraceae bacterium]|nr:hypothetical protein [Lachnospiraceae bacterium]MBQ9563736.1 hypothetical protein [Lachnospiraceae bacterium]MBQ9594052.1 hypothetical protein [Lachnospiraceae bacterium]MBR0153571.1 hypothetical protein [Lachnospiraceae bacterium]